MVAANRTTCPESNLLAELTSFRGRVEAIALLDRLFGQGARLVTLLGPAGMGKTRLASEWALHHMETPAAWDGYWFCDLAASTTPEALASAVLSGIELHLDASPGTRSRTLKALCASMKQRGAALVILDNVEQAVDDAATLVRSILEGCPQVHVLVTSRVRLRLRAERTVEVEPLDDATATSLFRDRALAAGATQEGVDRERDDIAAVVRGLDGIPLAIELAAARFAALGARGLRTHLSEHLGELRSAFRDGPARHETLDAAVTWSWDLLTPWERAALAQLAAFEGGFYLDAAERVVDLGAYPNAPYMAEVVASLNDSSLVFVSRPSGEDAPLRYRLLSPIAVFAAKRLAETPALCDAAHQRHALYYAELAEALADRAAHDDERPAVAALALERANIGVAHARMHTVEPAIAARLALAGQALWVTLGPDDDDGGLLDGALACARRSGDTHLLARALWHRGAHHAKHGRIERARVELEEALTMAERAGDRALQARICVDVGQGALIRAAATAAIPQLEIAVGHCASLGDVDLLLKAQMVLGSALTDARRLDDAVPQFTAALEVAREHGRYHEIVAHAWLATIGIEREDLSAAQHHADRAYELAAARPLNAVTMWAWLTRGVVRIFLGARDAARSDLERVIGASAAANQPAMPGYAHLWLAVASLADGDAEGALASWSAATRDIAPGVRRGHLALELVEAALAGSPPLPLAPEAPDEGESQLDRLVRLALRAHAAMAPGPADGRRLRVAADGTWFATEAAGRVDLSRRLRLPTLLAHLVKIRVAAPGQGVPATALFEAVWPESDLSSGSGINKVYVAVATLRELGLEPYLVRGRDGYFLSTAVPCECVGKRRSA